MGIGGSCFPWGQRRVPEGDPAPLGDGTAKTNKQQKKSLSSARWHLQVPGAESFWRRRWLVLGEGRKLRVTLTHRSARLIAGRCRRFITATRARRGCGCSARGAGARRGLLAPGCAGGASCLCQGEATVDISPLHAPGAAPSISSGASGCRGLFRERVTPSSASVPCPSGQLCLSWALSATLGSSSGAVLPFGEAPLWETGGKSTGSPGPIQNSPLS